MATTPARPQKKRRRGGEPPLPPPPHKSLKRKRDDEDLTALAERVAALDTSALATLPQTFAELPLSAATAAGLRGAHFTTLTDIQRRAVPVALQRRDVLGAAQTGSGKTLAFLVPVLENLHRQRWTAQDGLGALILAPTRELAIQIFEVLRRVGRHHTFSAGLVIGGKSLKEERERLGRMNILVCTPGRMLQHLDQTALFESTQLQMLVLDEADRILDLGFQATVDAIVAHLPVERQTLLFSATQTTRVADLARLSLRDPEYIAVHQQASTATPAQLLQHYVVVPLPEKLDTLWSFLRANVKTKILVFLSAGKQVRFVYESFRHLQPGIPLLHLHGRQKQTSRLDVVTKFGSAKHACLFATDVAARGLDFPAVDWVLQVDCPEDADTYIHRVGRTARFEKEGRAVLFLDPSENEGFRQRLEQKKVPVDEIRIRPAKQQSIKGQLQNMCFRDPELKYLGQKALIAYARSIHVQKDKQVFDVKKLALDEFSASMGLPGTPKIKFQAGESAKAVKNAPHRGHSSDSEDGESAKPQQKQAVRTKYDRMFERVNQDVLAPHYSNLLGENANASTNADGDSADEFLTVKRRLSVASSNDSQPEAATDTASSEHALTKPITITGLNANGDPLVIDSKRREKLIKSKKALLKYKGRGHKLVFDDEGKPHEVYEMQDEAAFRAQGDAEAQREQFVTAEVAALRQQDEDDKQLQREKRQAKKERRRERERQEQEGDTSRGVKVAPLDDGDEAEPGVDLDELNILGMGSDADEQDESSEADALPAATSSKGPKKWFQDSDSEGEAGEGTDPTPRKQAKKRRTREAEARDAETIEDLEALAQQYM